MKKRLNVGKIGNLLLLIIDILVVIWVNSGFKKEELFVWILFEIIVMSIPINVMFIYTKQTRKVRKVK